MSRRSKALKQELHKKTVEISVAEKLLLDSVDEIHGENLLCTTTGQAEFAKAFSAANPKSKVNCFFLDVAKKKEATLKYPSVPDNCLLTAGTDFPDQEFDAVVIPVQSGSDTELAREQLQDGFQKLSVGGKLFVAAKKRSDIWIHTEMQRMFPKVTRIHKEQGIVYYAVKKDSLKKVKDYSCELAFSFADRKAPIFTRPGVYNHRRVSSAAKSILEIMEVAGQDNVLILGAGSGAIAVTAALRAAEGHVHAIDSNCRAVECLQRSIEINELSNLTVELNSVNQLEAIGPYDWVISNPPLSTDNLVGNMFLETAARVLKPGGLVQIVTKHHRVYGQKMVELFADVCLDEIRNYFILTASKPGGDNDAEQAGLIREV